MLSSESKITGALKSSCTKGNKKSGMADHIWIEKETIYPWWDKVKIFDTEEHWKRRRLKEAANMLGYGGLLSRPSIEMNTTWESILKRPNQIAFIAGQLGL